MGSKFVDYRALYLSLFGDVSEVIRLLENHRWEERTSLLASALDQAISGLRLAQQKTEALYCGGE